MKVHILVFVLFRAEQLVAMLLASMSETRYDCSGAGAGAVISSPSLLGRHVVSLLALGATLTVYDCFCSILTNSHF